MEKPQLVRVDDRLIHGEVVVAWMGALKSARIVVVDDGVARDEFMKEVLRLSAPSECTLTVLSLEETLSHGPSHLGGALVLVKSPLTALKLRKGGIEFDHLNVGGLGARPGRRKVYRNISATPEEMEALRELERMGVEVEFQIVPTDSALPLSKVKMS